MTRDAKVFSIDNGHRQALQDAEQELGCFAEEGMWGIATTDYRIYVVSVSDRVDAALVNTYGAEPLQGTDLYIAALKQRPGQITLGAKDLTAFLVWK